MASVAAQVAGRWRLREWVVLWAMAAALVMAAGDLAGLQAQVVTGRGFGQAIGGFQDVNGNGVLDCMEPVTLEMFYRDPATDTTTGAITGQMVTPFAGESGLAFIGGSVEWDPLLSSGNCSGAIVSGNAAGDTEAAVRFACAPPVNGPNGGQANVVAFLYRASFVGTQPGFTAVLHGTTSDGLDVQPQLANSLPIGSWCSGGAGAQVGVVKSAAGTGVPGSTELYTITATDESGLGLGGVQLTEVVPAQTTFDAAASSPGWVCEAPAAGSLCRLAAGNLAPDGTLARFFAVDVAAPLSAGVASISNTACVRSGPATVVGCDSVSTPTAGQAVLSVVKKVASGTGAPGSTVVWNVTVANGGTQDSAPVTLTETVPGNTTWAGTGGWSCSGAQAGASCTLAVGSVAAGGAGVTVPFAVVVADPLPAGVTAIANTACAAAAGAAGGCATASAPTAGQPLLALTKTVAGSGAPGSQLVYSIGLQNSGSQGLGAVTVSEVVPNLTSFVAAASSPAWTCGGAAAGSMCTAVVAQLPAGGTATLAFAVVVESPLPANAGSIGNQACAAAAGVATACGATSTPTTGQPLLRLTKTYGGGAVVPGALVTFTLAVGNVGNEDLGAAVVSETVPPLATFVASASDPRWTCAGTGAGSACTLALPAVAAGSSQSIAFAVRAAATLPAAAVIANAACVTGVAGAPEAAARAMRRAVVGKGGRPAPVAAPAACGSVETVPAVSIDTTLAADVVGHAAPARPGDRIHYVLTIPNATGGVLPGVAVTAALDPNTALVVGTVVSSQGTVSRGNGSGDAAVAVALGDLAAGATATVEWEVAVANPLPAGVTAVAAQAETTGTSIPPDASGPPPPPSTPGPTETPVAAAPPPEVVAVPTLGGWGLGVMAVLLAGAAAVVLGRRTQRVGG